MKKLRLELDTLNVASFDTAAETHSVGTVQGHDVPTNPWCAANAYKDDCPDTLCTCPPPGDWASPHRRARRGIRAAGARLLRPVSRGGVIPRFGFSITTVTGPASPFPCSCFRPPAIPGSRDA